MALMRPIAGLGCMNGMALKAPIYLQNKYAPIFFNTFFAFESGFVSMLGYVEPIRRFFI